MEVHSNIVELCVVTFPCMFPAWDLLSIMHLHDHYQMMILILLTWIFAGVILHNIQNGNRQVHC